MSTNAKRRYSQSAQLIFGVNGKGNTQSIMFHPVHESLDLDHKDACWTGGQGGLVGGRVAKAERQRFRRRSPPF